VGEFNAPQPGSVVEPMLPVPVRVAFSSSSMPTHLPLLLRVLFCLSVFIPYLANWTGMTRLAL
jgi:hypothetical protein